MKNLITLRERFGLRQADVAEKIGVSKQAYGLYETDKRQASYETLCKLADFFEVTVDYLLDREQTSIQQLPPEQAELLRIYEVLPPSQRQGLLQIVKMYASLSPTMQKNSLIYFRTLAGFKKAVDEGIISDRDMLDL